MQQNEPDPTRQVNPAARRDRTDRREPDGEPAEGERAEESSGVDAADSGIAPREQEGTPRPPRGYQKGRLNPRDQGGIAE